MIDINNDSKEYDGLQLGAYGFLVEKQERTTLHAHALIEEEVSFISTTDISNLDACINNPHNTILLMDVGKFLQIYTPVSLPLHVPSPPSVPIKHNPM